MKVRVTMAKELHLELPKRLMKSFVSSLVSYRVEMCTLRTEDEKRLEALKMSIWEGWRKFAGWTNLVMNRCPEEWEK